ncbi:hypothetical protein, partial [Massilia genomosp. 1]|uniref:hypothetical protein n=1 Tax=Massilia genomosp. 1 TaxID=2609280 RepID=UPI00141F7679
AALHAKKNLACRAAAARSGHLVKRFRRSIVKKSTGLSPVDWGVHALDDDRYQNQREPNDKWGNDAERLAGQTEADIASELREPVRDSHKGIAPIHVDDPTQHTRTNPDGSYTWVKDDYQGNEVQGPD